MKHTLTHTEYCNNRMARLNTPCKVFPDGVVLFDDRGEWLTRGEFNSRYPIHLPLKTSTGKKDEKGENPNKKLIQ